MLGLGKILRFQARLMALRANRSGLRRSQGLKPDDLAGIAAAFDVRLRRTMTRLAAMLIALQQRRMRSVCEVFLPDFLMTRLADVGLGILSTRRTRQRSFRCSGRSVCTTPPKG